jgi:two-component system, OmpR family, phosphate regulon sensor histidine kinase PhoR
MASEIETAPRKRKKTGRLTVFLILFTSFLAMIAAAAISVEYSVHRYWRSVLLEEITRNLTQKAQMFAARVNTDHTHRIAEIASQGGQNAGSRATVIDGNGKVLADSEIPIASLEHESHRPEFIAALRGEIGSDTRKHNTFGIPVLYVAVPVSGGAVRLAYPLADVAIANTRGRQVLLLGATIAVFAALAISALAAQTVLRRPTP